MKSLVFSCSIIIALLAASTGLRCWVCENVYSHEECQRRGRMEECESTQNTCQLTLRHGGWGEKNWIEKSCKQLEACGNNHVQDSHDASVFLVENTQCNRKIPSSVCRCCCSTDGCNQNLTDCGPRLGGLPCPALDRPKHGDMECMGGNMPNSVCMFSCRSGYQMEGAAMSRCDLFSKRDYPAPTCKKIKIRCPMLTEQTHGTSFCTRRNLHRSRCNFTCESGFKLVGASRIECYQDFKSVTLGTWSRPQPQCRPLECPPQFIRNGIARCTNRFFVGSTCTFECRGKYRLEPATGRGSNMCQRNERWTRRPPCCVLPCPPNAYMDFVVVLDSSSSVGAENWGQMKKFVRLFLRVFNVGVDATHIAVIRYNRVVDTRTQILFNDYPNSMDNVLKAFDRIPYDGSGTNTGNAINYTASVLLKNGNRPDARDVVLLITDGASQDDVVLPSAILHRTDALVFVLPVQPPRGRLDLDEIETIAGNPDNVIRDALDGGFAALDKAFAERIGTLLCSSRCAE